MDKVGMCMGCRQEFPKMQLKRCSGCERVQYCSTLVDPQNILQQKDTNQVRRIFSISGKEEEKIEME